MEKRLIGAALLAVAWSGVESQAFNAVTFTSPTKGFVLGDSGSLWVTGDAGERWTEKKLGNKLSLEAVHFPTPSVGYMVGLGTLLKTVDGGETWNDPGKFKTGAWLSSVHFTSAEVGHTVGLAIQERTEDGGATWPEVGLNGLGYPSYRDIWFTDANNGVKVGMVGRIFRSVDGGINWDSTAARTSKDLLAVHFPTATVGYAVGIQGAILKSTNGGAAWSLQNSGTTARLNDVFFVDANTGYAVGERTYAPAIFKTTDGGATWAAQTVPPLGSDMGSLSSVFFTDANTGFAVGYLGGLGLGGILLKTTDGGAHWTSKSPTASVVPGLARNRQPMLHGDGSLVYELEAPAEVSYSIFDPRGVRVYRSRKVEGKGAHSLPAPNLRGLQGNYLVDFQVGGARHAFRVPILPWKGSRK